MAGKQGDPNKAFRREGRGAANFFFPSARSEAGWKPSSSSPPLRALTFRAAGKRGFTLIELMVILFCMVIAASIIVPRFSSFQRSGQAKDAARNIMNFVREAREISIEKQRAVTLESHPDGRVLILRYDDSQLPILDSDNQMNGSNMPGGFSSAGNADPETPEPPLYYPDSLAVMLQTSDPSSSGLQTAGTSSSGQSMTFTPDGKVSDADIIVLYAPDRGYSVQVRRQGTDLRILNGAEAAASQGMM